jgi:hypothetical protein
MRNLPIPIAFTLYFAGDCSTQDCVRAANKHFPAFSVYDVYSEGSVISVTLKPKYSEPSYFEDSDTRAATSFDL